MNQDENEETKITVEKPTVVTVEKPTVSDDGWYARHFPALMGIVFLLLFAILILTGRE